MQDLFDDIPALDISVLTEKKETDTNDKTGEAKNSKDSKDSKESKDTKTEDTPRGLFDVDDKETVGIREEDTEDTKNTSEGGEGEEGENESPIKLLSSFLKEKGAIDYTDEEFSDNDEFIPEQVNKTIEKKATEGIQEYKDSLPEEIKQLIDNYEDGVPLGQLLESEQKTFELSSITEDKLSQDSRLQEEIVEADLLRQGWTKDETNERIRELQDAGIMEKWANKSLGKLLQLERDNKEAAIRQVQEKKKADAAHYNEQINNLQNTIKDTKEFFEGVSTNDIEKKSVFEAITKYDKTGRNKISQLLADPKNYIKVAYFLEVMKGDISKLKTAAKTAAIKDTKKTIDSPVKTSRFGGKDLSVIKNFLKSRP